MVLKFNFNTNQIQSFTNLVGKFSDNNTVENFYATVPLYSNSNNVGQLVTNGIITELNNCNNNNNYTISIISTIFIDSIGTITYNYSTQSDTKFILTPFGTTLVCKITSSSEKLYNYSDKIIINYHAGGIAEISIY